MRKTRSRVDDPGTMKRMFNRLAKTPKKGTTQAQIRILLVESPGNTTNKNGKQAIGEEKARGLTLPPSGGGVQGGKTVPNGPKATGLSTDRTNATSDTSHGGVNRSITRAKAATKHPRHQDARPLDPSPNPVGSD
eukprot:scaffold280_cov391-Pavlova_lutheri.AAC.6